MGVECYILYGNFKEDWKIKRQCGNYTFIFIKYNWWNDIELVNMDW